VCSVGAAEQKNQPEGNERHKDPLGGQEGVLCEGRGRGQNRGNSGCSSGASVVIVVVVAVVGVVGVVVVVVVVVGTLAAPVACLRCFDSRARRLRVIVAIVIALALVNLLLFLHFLRFLLRDVFPHHHVVMHGTCPALCLLQGHKAQVECAFLCSLHVIVVRLGVIVNIVVIIVDGHTAVIILAIFKLLDWGDAAFGKVERAHILRIAHVAFVG